jgi:Icc-related predicted phosphoesterase
VTTCLFVSDLHGREARWNALFQAIGDERPEAVFLGGDLLPHSAGEAWLETGLFDPLRGLRNALGPSYPEIFTILGNDDARAVEPALEAADSAGLLSYIHGRVVEWNGWTVVGYAFVPPTPFGLKDWERYDVSRSTDPGCVSPEEGVRTAPFDAEDVRYGTIARDLEALADGVAMDRSVWLFHTPPYRTDLDRAALDGRMVDHVPMDVHVGSIAVQRFIEDRQPRLTLHGHVHESARLTGSWRQRIGTTWCLGAAHDGAALALVSFDLNGLPSANRRLLL